jgi:hypothetical protein
MSLQEAERSMRRVLQEQMSGARAQLVSLMQGASVTAWAILVLTAGLQI